MTDTIKKGTVALIGAGPGDPGLITVKGLEALHECDAVVYDNLIPGDLIVSLSSTVEKHYVGKIAGHHSLPQDDINQLLVDLALKGKHVARLKGGDPFIFGRGGEEARFLKQHGIEYSIIPGVTAGVAGPAYSGIPCTDRTKSSFVTFLTGHKASSKEHSTVDWKWIAEGKAGTVVIYMGVGEAENIVNKLTSFGMSPDTPAAAIEKATLPEQRVVTSTLAELPAKIKSEDIRPPALLTIGESVALRPEIKWLEDKPLSGLRVMVTRPADQARELYRSLRDLGADLLTYPTIATRENIDQDTWKKIEEFSSAGHDKKWLVFTSENGVRYFIRQLVSQIGDIRWLGGFKIAAIGNGTARALDRYSLKPDFMPTCSTVAELATQMKVSLDMKDAEIVRVQGDLADERVVTTLTEAGAKVYPLIVYDTYTPEWPDAFKERLIAGPPDVIMFSSGSTATGLTKRLNPDELKQVTKEATVVSIGPMTSHHIITHGMKVTVEARKYSIPGMIDALVEYFQDNPPKKK